MILPKAAAADRFQEGAMDRSILTVLGFALIAAIQSSESLADGMRHFSHHGVSVVAPGVVVTRSSPVVVAPTRVVASHVVVVTRFSPVVVAPSNVVVVKPVRVRRVVFIASPLFFAPPLFFDPPMYYSPGYVPAPGYPPATNYQYYCPDTRLYYPEATECPSGWLKVVPGGGEPPY